MLKILSNPRFYARFAFSLMIFVAGVAVGLSQARPLERLTQNVDVSDYVSLTLISLLSIGLWLSLRRKTT